MASTYSNFNKLRLNNDLVDINIIADGRIIPAHRLVLGAMSSVFLNMFRRQNLSSFNMGYSFPATSVFIDFIYGINFPKSYTDANVSIYLEALSILDNYLVVNKPKIRDLLYNLVSSYYLNNKNIPLENAKSYIQCVPMSWNYNWYNIPDFYNNIAADIVANYPVSLRGLPDDYVIEVLSSSNYRPKDKNRSFILLTELFAEGAGNKNYRRRNYYRIIAKRILSDVQFIVLYPEDTETIHNIYNYSNILPNTTLKIPIEPPYMLKAIVMDFDNNLYRLIYNDSGSNFTASFQTLKLPKLGDIIYIKKLYGSAYDNYVHYRVLDWSY